MLGGVLDRLEALNHCLVRRHEGLVVLVRPGVGQNVFQQHQRRLDVGDVAAHGVGAVAVLVAQIAGDVVTEVQRVLACRLQVRNDLRLIVEQRVVNHDGDGFQQRLGIGAEAFVSLLLPGLPDLDEGVEGRHVLGEGLLPHFGGGAKLFVVSLLHGGIQQRFQLGRVVLHHLGRVRASLDRETLGLQAHGRELVQDVGGALFGRDHHGETVDFSARAVRSPQVRAGHRNKHQQHCCETKRDLGTDAHARQFEPAFARHRLPFCSHSQQPLSTGETESSSTHENLA